MPRLFSEPSTQAWIWLAVSGLLETAWVMSLKGLGGPHRLVPLLTYAITGFGAAFFLSLALRHIPIGSAYAAWMGISVVGTLVVDVAWYQQPWNALRAACVVLIALGTCGLTLVRAH